MTAERVAVADVALWVLYTLAALGALSALALGGWIAAHHITHRHQHGDHARVRPPHEDTP